MNTENPVKKHRIQFGTEIGLMQSQIFRVQVVRFGGWGFEFGVWSLGSWVWGLEVGVDKISVTKGASISCLLWQAEIGLRQSWTFKVHIVGIAVSGFGG